MENRSLYVRAESKSEDVFEQNSWHWQGWIFPAQFVESLPLSPFVYFSECFSHCLRLLSDNLI